jgi:hypothetical protein
MLLLAPTRTCRPFHYSPSSFRRRPEELFNSEAGHRICSSTLERRAFVRLRRPSYFLFAWPKRKLTKEKGHPAWRLPGILPGKSVSRRRAFRQDSCPGEKESTSLSTPASRPVVPASPPHRGPGRAAGHRGPHFSEELKQSRARATTERPESGRRISQRLIAFF